MMLLQRVILSIALAIISTFAIVYSIFRPIMNLNIYA